jgi:hypothetical protein
VVAVVSDDEPPAPTMTPTVAEGATDAELVADDDDDDGSDPLRDLALPGVDERWRRFVRALQLSRGGTFRMGKPRSLAGPVEVVFPVAYTADEARRMVNEAEVQKALATVFGADATMVIAHGDDSTPSIQEAEQTMHRQLQAQLEAHAKSHPVVQKAVALFGGEVKMVKRH